MRASDPEGSRTVTLPDSPASSHNRRRVTLPFDFCLSEMQKRLLAEVARVLHPGGVFAGTDSLYSRSFRLPACTSAKPAFQNEEQIDHSTGSRNGKHLESLIAIGFQSNMGNAFPSTA
jgi:hypothetical protein